METAQSSTPSSFLDVQHLRKQFKKRVVVKDVSFNVHSNEVIGLLGPNGAGKTTSFYMVAGLLASDGGDIYLDGKNIKSTPVHKRAELGLGYLPQEASIFRQMTVEENVVAILELKNLDRKSIKREAERLLTSLNIDHLRDVSAMALSGGERRRCEIARALANNPRFILLDEPFAGVDPIAVSDIQNVVKLLKDLGIGVIITDHNVRETLRICDRAYIISEGNVLASGIPSELVQNEKVKQVYLGENFTF
ncbi:MAG: lipopolysaccharide export system ATP-binding protein [Pseudomonadota bacterium]|jgi:lipopolysaccharide export system ATP-binding protein|nr:LPS export ABC transporter ATP-binding protein [Burkholderiales bacterium]MBP9768586.1 LPS export ABC transporter ATP-binding protein [Burkholderiales bacterium]MDQ5948553.1 lipopolysaccharide export system ATP-binding protein [Pseudomonadota bacterium]